MGFWLIFGLSTFSIVCDVQMFLSNSTLILLLFQLIYKPPWSFWVSTAHYLPTHSTCNDIVIDACIYFAFFSQNLGIKLYFANISRLTVFATIIFVQVLCNDHLDFSENFQIFAFFVTSEKSICEYVMFEFVWDCHFCRFWMAQPKCIFCVTVTCDMWHNKFGLVAPT